MKRIVLTGGGTAGHVTPNIALMPALEEAGYKISYIGSYEGMERKMIEDLNIPYAGVATGKLRRYWDLRNFTDPFRVLKGYREAKANLKYYQPDVVFSKGGFVSVPVVRAAAALKIPCIVHESDFTPGLANKLCFPVATKICCNFPETLDMLPKGKGVLTGSPVRRELFEGDAARGRAFCGFTEDKPVLMVIGGSLGAMAVNQAVRDALPHLLEKYQVVHICGKDKMDNLLLTTPGYKQFEFVGEELKDIFAVADLVISRAGANAICELLALQKPNILIPLPSKSSRGDQLLNAQSFADQGFSIVIDQDDLVPSDLIKQVDHLYKNRQKYISAMSSSQQKDGITEIMHVIQEVSG